MFREVTWRATFVTVLLLATHGDRNFINIVVNLCVCALSFCCVKLPYDPELRKMLERYYIQKARRKNNSR